ncbi:unnamed protein product [Rotaria magnacalcarata]|nr:unnamed protein product [Rotaria magnacalcarata]CAF1539194.1 unnamed protein product [Rotaria magnacalcarata]CAF2040187.1 unnamed protein product [Rotaria magnacalcarata]CAF2051252.1 unnamed protein product [Rotaria magnacalcarata]CAF2155884.1 unnamed protein product [Rotaria magnacalcarata]
MAWDLELNPTLLEELYFWIDSIPLSKTKTKIERDFSDGILVAEIIRHYLPDMVDMHNYTVANSFNPKKINWGQLNKRILCPLNLDLPDKIIIDLCNGKPGVVEVFLFKLRQKIDEELELRQKLESQLLPSPNQSLLALNIIDSKKESTNIVSNRSSRISKSIGSFTSRWVSRRVYEELKQQSLEQDEEIQILRAKLRRLEHILQLKDIRISELACLIEETQRKQLTTLGTGKNKNKYTATIYHN